MYHLRCNRLTTVVEQQCYCWHGCNYESTKRTFRFSRTHWGGTIYLMALPACRQKQRTGSGTITTHAWQRFFIAANHGAALAWGCLQATYAQRYGHRAAPGKAWVCGLSILPVIKSAWCRNALCQRAGAIGVHYSAPWEVSKQSNHHSALVGIPYSLTWKIGEKFINCSVWLRIALFGYS